MNKLPDGKKPDTKRDANQPTVGIPAPLSPLPSLSGTVLGDYIVLEAIGSGGGGRVYRAQHQHMGRIVAIKVLPHAADRTADAVERFRREVKAAARLLHPNIVTAFDAGEVGETQYLVMEFVDGKSLFEIVQENGPVSLAEATTYIIEAARGLEYAHSQRIIHRDIKPSNIMVDASGTIKLLDMGLARLHGMTSQGSDVSLGPELTEQGLVIGTVGYIAPEQILNAHNVDERTDIYGLGCTFHFLLTGSPPYSGSVMQTLMAHTQEPVPSVCEKRGDLPLALDDTFRRMLAKKSADRFATMSELIVELQTLTNVSEAVTQVTPSAGVGVTPVGRDSSRRVNVQDTGITAKAVGFDVGTTNAYVSWIADEGIPVPVPSQHGSASTPSVVAFKEGTFQFGETAFQLAKAGGSNIADHFVCKLGIAGSGISFRAKEIPVELLTAVLVHKLAEHARRNIGYFSHLVYTVPGCFGEVQRKAYQDAYRIASLNTLDPINASTAVVVYFSFLQGWLNPQRTAPTKTLLVFRYGAGSFDATVYRVGNRQITTLSVAGDSAMGGRVWDERIAQSVAGQLADKYGVDISNDPAKLFELRQQCETAKVALSDQDRIPIRFQAREKTLEGILSRTFLSRLGSDLLSRPKELTEQALSAAGVGWQDLDHVLLAGGTSRMPLVQEMVQAWAGEPGICSLIGPEAAPQGAALYAQIQIVQNLPNLDFDIQEVKSHYLGIVGVNRQTGERQMSVVIPQNVALPASAQSTFTTVQDGQTSLALDIVEGSDPSSTDWRPIGRCHISNLPPGMPKGTSIAFDFEVAQNGILSISVESAATGQRTSPQIQRANGLTTKERNHWRDWLQTGLMCGQFE